MQSVCQTLATRRPLTNALLLVIPLELESKNNCRQTGRHRWHANVGSRHSHKRRQRRLSSFIPNYVRFTFLVYEFFPPPSTSIFTTLEILLGGFTPVTQIKFGWKFGAFSTPREFIRKKTLKIYLC